MLTKAIYFFPPTRSLVWADGGEVYGDYGLMEGRGWGYMVSGPLSLSLRPSTGERGRVEAVTYSQRSLPLAEAGRYCVDFLGDNMCHRVGDTDHPKEV